MATQAENLADLVALTLAELGKFKWTDIASTLQSYPFARKLLVKKARKTLTGKSIQFNLMSKEANLAKWVGLYEADNYYRPDGAIQGTVPWRHGNANFVIDRREIAMNADPAQIVDLVAFERAQAMSAKAKLIEIAGWGGPTSASDDKTMFGFPYWIQPNATTGFNGGDNSYFAAGPAGLASATYANWKNYTIRYSAVDAAFLDDIRKAAGYTEWEPPVEMPQYDTGEAVELYTTWTCRKGLVNLLESRNDNLGWSLDDRDPVFQKSKILWVPRLDSDATNPLYGINWGTFKFVFLKGENMVQTGPRPVPGMHVAVATDIDWSFNLVCYDRRKNWMANTA